VHDAGRDLPRQVEAAHHVPGEDAERQPLFGLGGEGGRLLGGPEPDHRGDRAERPGSAGTFPVYDLARTGAIIGYAAAASAEDADAAVSAAEAAWPAWAAL
jgi:hypothetical protein